SRRAPGWPSCRWTERRRRSSLREPRRTRSSSRFASGRRARCTTRWREASRSGKRRVDLARPDSVTAAAGLLGNGAVALAGGTDLVPLLRDRIVAADTLVDLRSAVPKGGSGTTIGAGTTLRELEVDAQIPDPLPERGRLSASPQLRAAGTIGGNLLQATRCWYWRLKFPCRLHGGDRCHARDGQHREHAIFANDFCASAHPSDPAAALLALGATVRTDRR